MKFLLFILCSLLANISFAQVPIFDFPVADFTVDDNDNIYVADALGTIQKYDNSLKLVNDYRAISNGLLYNIDASNPMQVLLNYKDVSKLLLLDRMMSPKFELDLSVMGIFNSKAIASSRDGQLWIFDEVNAKLYKINEQLNSVVESNDLRLSFESPIHPTHIEEQNNRVVLTDPKLGIYIFDRFANFVQQLEIRGLTYFQLLDDYLIYLDSTYLTTYNFEEKTFIRIDLKISDIKKVRLTRTYLYYLLEDELYKIPTNHFFER